MNLSGHKKGLLLFLFTLLSIAFMIFFNDVSTYVHIKELKILIQKNNTEESDQNHINLIMNYKINQKLYDKTLIQSDADLREMRSNLLFLSEAKKARVEMEKYRIISIPVLHMINGLRFVMGKGPIRDLLEDKISDYLSIAYYFERNKQYAKALEIYNQALNESEKEPQKQAAILLHQGYCYAMIGESQKSREKYKTIIQTNKKDDIMLTALVLLKYLDGFEREIKTIQEKETNPVEKGEKLYQLLAYQDSLKVLNEVESKADLVLKSRIKYLKGRSQEELGQKEEAIASYQSIISADKNSPYAKAANSRIFVAATREVGGDKIKELALKNNEILKDENLTKMAQEHQSLSKETANFESNLKESVLYGKVKDSLSENIKINDQIVQKNKPSDPVIEKTPAIVNKIQPQTQTQTKPKRIQIRVTTLKGDVFTGELSRETDQLLILKTLIGEVQIRKMEILSRKNLN